MKIKFTKYRKVCYAFSGFLFLISFFAVVFLGVNPGIDFAGGSVIELDYEEENTPSLEDVSLALKEGGFDRASVQLVGRNSIMIRSDAPEEDARRAILEIMPPAKQIHSESVSPIIGDELRDKSIIAVLIASALVVIYIAISFREDDGSINSVKYGVVAAGIAFLHDIFIIVGIFAVLGYFYGAQLTIPITVALLTTLGYSINDTVVIFDRIRENLRKNTSGRDSLEKIIDISLNQVVGRSLSTSITTLAVLMTMLFFGGPTLYYFVLALIIGVILGTYSSIFLAAPAVLDWNNLTHKKK